MERAAVPFGWKEFTLGELFDFSNGVNADKSAYGDGIPFINVLEVIDNEALTEANIPGRIKLVPSLAARYGVQYGDVLLNRTSETQDEVALASVYLGDTPVVFGGFVFRARPKTNSLDERYSKYALRVKSVREQIVARGQGGIRANIGQRDLKTVQISLPPVEEQRTIAKALSDVDELVNTLNQAIAKKQAIKQGMVQQLLTGEVRLPGFISGTWENRPLRKGVSLISGTHVMARDCNTRGIGTPYLTGPADFPRGKIKQTKFTTRPISLCKAGDILITVKGSGSGSMVEADAEYCISRQLMAIRSSEWNSRFLYYSLLYNASQIKAASAGLIPGLSRSNILDQQLPIPPTTAEQRAIAEALSSIDDQIEDLKRLRAHKRAIKMGMTQQLLTGRTRLPVKEGTV